MSEFLGSAQGIADSIAAAGAGGFTWRAGLRGASFRGVPFYVTEAAGDDGRRVVAHEFPLRDEPFTEDMGRSARRWRLTGYVLGEAYFADRDALIDACAASAKPGTLVHPFLGELRARCESISYRESLKEGRFCTFDLVFVEEGGDASPVEGLDTLRGVLAGVSRVLRLARTVYRIAAMARGDLAGFAAGVALGFLGNLAGGMAAAWLSLPGISLAGVRAAIGALDANPGTDVDAVAQDVAEPYVALARAEALPVAAADAGAAFASRPDAAPAGEIGDALLAAAALPAPTAQDAEEQAALSSLHALAADAAVAAAAEAYAVAPWATADAALAARDALMAAIDARLTAAGDAGQDDLFGAWRSLAAAVQADMTDRAARLPRRAAYRLPGPLPALALAHRLHGTAARADELVALSAVPHPGVMPAEGWMLRP